MPARVRPYPRLLELAREQGQPVPKAKRKREPEVATGGPYGWCVTLTVPCRVVSEANQRIHWAVRNRRKTDQWNSVYSAVVISGLGSWFPLGSLAVTFTAIGPRPLDDDNLAGAFKFIRDWLARFLGTDDGITGRATWHYRQEKGPPGVRIEIKNREE